MTDIHIGIWAKDSQTFHAVMAQFGLLTGLATNKPQWHPDLRLAGAGFGGWPGIISNQTGTDADGFPIMTARPGVYVNAWVLDHDRAVTGRKSLARNLRHLVNPDLSETKIEQLKEDGAARKTLMERCRLTSEALAKGGRLTLTKGIEGDAKMPSHRLEILNAKGALIFAAYSLEPDDENRPATPRNVWC